MMHLYSSLLCIAVHPKRFTIMWGGGGLSSDVRFTCVSPENLVLYITFQGLLEGGGSSLKFISLPLIRLRIVEFS